MKILITGIPGTGKTTIGNYLESEKGYLHLNMELARQNYQTWGAKTIQKFIETQVENKVITWGFIPVYDDSRVEELLELGYKIIWFDGNRDAARREFLKRGDVPVEALDNQMVKIEKFDLKKFNPIIINTFSENGVFLKKDEIVKLILEKSR